MNIPEIIAKELNVKVQQVNAAIELLDDGATVPFIARYRKELTGTLTDTDLRHLEERLGYLRELDARRQVILASIVEQGKLTPELESSILATDNKASLEDLYLPFKPKRRTKAQIAKEAGLEALALELLNEPQHIPEQRAGAFLNPEKDIHTVADALEGARYILVELFAENSDLLSYLRDYLWQHSMLTSKVIADKEMEGNKFQDYFDYQEAIKKIPSHRGLALFRGQQENILRLRVQLNPEQEAHCLHKIQQQFAIRESQSAGSAWLLETVMLAWRAKLAIKLEIDSLVKLRENAEEEAIKVFASNLKNLLLAAPAGSRVTLGLDPGFRTGVKVVVVDGTGKLLTHTSIFPHAPRNAETEALAVLAKLCQQFSVELVSIGNGTASRETDRLVTELKKNHPELKLSSIVVSEAGASVYSASAYAAQEFPDLDVSYRGAVSIGRRLQDPLAELVKIDPKAIGVGQYQHDVNQSKLSKSLQAVMEDCVNQVGVDVNTASAPLLACVAGLNEAVAKNIIHYRLEHGLFSNRRQLKNVPRLGEKAFEQAAGFLRIRNGDNPLDASAVHPEAYAVVERILAKTQKSFTEIFGNQALLRNLKAKEYTDSQFGLPTVTDILQELEKPGRDPRPEFKAAVFKEGVEKLTDLKPGMILEGVVTNVANFGAFVDIGVHQDGLVHISLLANRFVKNPHEVVKVGDIVTVKVVEIDVARKRIQLSMKLDETAATAVTSVKPAKPTKIKKPASKPSAPPQSALGDALLTALRNDKRNN